MADLKPIGSEKLQGQDKLRRIMEIARFNETTPSIINETSKSEYSRTLSDGSNYEIVKERQGYIIKKTISESESEYIEPMKNRRYYSSYSQALKRLNLVAGELNRLNENEKGTSLFGEQKKFTLKTPKPDPAPAEVAPPPVAPPSVPSPELPASPIEDMGTGEDSLDVDTEMADDSLDVDTEMGDDSLDVDTEVGSDTSEVGEDDKVTFKTIQKLTGKLTQKIRTLENEKGMTSEDIKYVINMVLSSLDLSSLSEDDKEDIVDKFEENDNNDEDLTDDSEVEDIQSDMDIPMEGEIGEDMYGSFGNLGRKDYKGDTYYDENDRPTKDSDLYGIGGDDFDTEEFDSYQKLYDKYGDKQKWFNDRDGEKMFNTYKEKTGKPFKVKTRKSDFGNGAIIDSIFGESKVDKVISKYFEVSKKEIMEGRERVANKKLEKISRVRKQMKEIVKLTESIEQELASQKFLTENISAKIIGKTNKKNLVFENKGKQIKITPEGQIL